MQVITNSISVLRNSISADTNRVLIFLNTKIFNLFKK